MIFFFLYLPFALLDSYIGSTRLTRVKRADIYMMNKTTATRQLSRSRLRFPYPSLDTGGSNGVVVSLWQRTFQRNKA